MCQTVGDIYEEHMIHAKVLICKPEFGSSPKVLDEKTIDFIEARYQDIIMDSMLSGDLFSSEEFTCKAGFIEEERYDIKQGTSLR
jgi:hypothetical protein